MLAAFFVPCIPAMTIEEFLKERSRQPTFSAAEIYGQLRAQPVSHPDFSKDLHTIIDYLVTEMIRFPEQERLWLNNKISELVAEYDAYVDQKWKDVKVKKMEALMLKRKKLLPPSDDRFTEYGQSENL